MRAVSSHGSLFAISVGLCLGCTGCGAGASGQDGSTSGQDGGGSTGEIDAGQEQLMALDTLCQGVAGLTGQSILDQRVEHIEATLRYVYVADTVPPNTMVTVDATWPTAPVAACYPPRTVNGTVVAGARVAIPGLSLRFHTADGAFDETVPAKAWRLVLNGAPQSPYLVAVTTTGAIHGTFRPPPNYVAATAAMFTAGLSPANPAGSGGNVALSGQDPAELNAGVFRGSFAMATWP